MDHSRRGASCHKAAISWGSESALGGGECSGAEVSDHYHKMSIEQMRAHLARAESELQAAQRFLNLKTRGDAEFDVARAVANARLSVGDALETLKMMGEPGG
jgi:hypothetical protein